MASSGKSPGVVELWAQLEGLGAQWGAWTCLWVTGASQRSLWSRPRPERTS